MMEASSLDTGLEINGPITPAFSDILTPDALAFVSSLCDRFANDLEPLLAARKTWQARIDAGALPDFLPETQSIRDGDWRVAKLPDDLLDRRVEITGPVDRKMVINALNAPVKCFMADFEDSQSPTWEGMIQGQINLRDAVNGTIEFVSPEGKEYRLKDKTAVLIARVRGLHLPESHVLFNGKAIPGCLLDFGLYFFHNARTLLDKGTGPYFYVPKLQSHLEARWWNDVFSFAEDSFDLARGTIKATILIETLPAVFEMDEILYELKDHIAGLNCGRWDYIFSFIKTFRNHPERVLPDRHLVSMDKHFLDSYSKLLVKTCHRRGAFAMGGMSAFIPSKDASVNEVAFQKVKEDKEREVRNGHDGTWVAHPGLSDVAMTAFEAAGGKNQLDKIPDVDVTAADLLKLPSGDITEAGLRGNIRVAVYYIEAWISGLGCVPLYNLMEDAATAEISRTQIWQWIKHPSGVLEDGRKITKELFRAMLAEELTVIQSEVGDERYQSGRFSEAADIMDKITTSDDLIDFLTLEAYQHLD